MDKEISYKSCPTGVLPHLIYLVFIQPTYLEKAVNEYGVSIMEVIGHTDGQPLTSSRNGNLDEKLEQAAHNLIPIDNLYASSNTELALIRALSVVKHLRRNPGLQGAKFRVYSAGQLILPNGDNSLGDRNPDPLRNRVEIQFRIN